MCTLKSKILSKHPCNECLVKSMCGNNLCEDYSKYYYIWKDRTHGILDKLTKDMECELYNSVYWYVMSKFINVPGMPERIPLSDEKLKYATTGESYYRQLFFKHIGGPL